MYKMLNCCVSIGDVSRDVVLFHRGWNPPEILRLVILVVDNLGSDVSRNAEISSVVSQLLVKGLKVRIALPRREKVSEKHSFQELLEASKGASRCARVIRGAIAIEHEKELQPLTQPLQTTLQTLSEERTRVATGAPRKESISQRVSAAVGIYEKATSIAQIHHIPGTNVKEGQLFSNIVAINLWLRGITYVPASFRATMLFHPDFSEEENHTMLNSEDKRTELSPSLLEKEVSLVNKVVFYKGYYWKVVSDKRCGLNAFLELYGPSHQGNGPSNNKMQLNIIQDLGGVAPAFLCNFKRYARIIPFFDEGGMLTGVERTFFASNGQQERKRALKSKLARGITNGSSAILFPESGPGRTEPKIKVLGEGSENVLSALEAFGLAKPSRIRGQSDEMQFCSALGVSDVIKTPIEKSVHTIMLVMDNDGYNIETKQTMIDTVGHFLSKNLKVQVIFAPSSSPGEKRDLNDVLREEGLEAAKALVLNPIHITEKEQLGPPNELLQFHFTLVSLKSKLNSKYGIGKITLLLELGRTCVFLRKYDDALDYFNQIAPLIVSVGQQRNLEERLDELTTQMYDGMGLAYLEKGEPDRAMPLYRKALMRKMLPSALHGLGRCHLEKGDLTSSHLQDCVRMYPDSPHVLIDLGTQEFRRGNFGSAMFYLRKVSECSSESFSGPLSHSSEGRSYTEARSFELMGDIHKTQLNYDQALMYYKRAQSVLNKMFCSDRHGKDTNICLGLSDVYLAKGSYTLSVLHSKKILQKSQSPSSSVLWLLLHQDKTIAQIPLAGRQVVIDLEMTGDAPDRDRIIDVGCVVLKDLKKTGDTFQEYVNPKTPVRPQAHKLTGLTLRFLSSFPIFEEVARNFLQFIEGADLIFHGASSDIKFLTKELGRIGIDYDFRMKHHIIDTLEMARAVFPLEKNNLDALNQRLNINRTRLKHRALLDAEITADVYIALKNKLGTDK
jgi:DNA polymerase-3 subunit epsilon